MRIQHLIPLTDDLANPDLRAAERFTLQTVLLAKKKAEHEVDVTLLSPIEGRINDPPEFAAPRRVLRSTHITTSDSGTVSRALPYLGDIIGEVDPESELTIFTNPDISLYPTFYSQVAALAQSGFAGSITRRSVPGKPHNWVPLSWAFLAKGKPHAGHDCFFFPGHLARSFISGEVFLGSPPIGKIMLLNVALQHERTLIFKTQRATFHFGNEKPWAQGPLSDDRVRNTAASRAVVADLISLHGTSRVRAVAERLGMRWGRGVFDGF